MENDQEEVAAPAPAKKIDKKKQLKTLIVKNIGPSTTESDLDTLFSNVGPIKHCFVVKDEETKELCAGYGFVNFAFATDAEKALKKLQGSRISGRRILLEWARPREQRSYIPKSKRVTPEEDENEEKSQSSDDEDMAPITAAEKPKSRSRPLMIADPARVIVLSGENVTTLDQKMLREFFKTKRIKVNLSKFISTADKVYLTFGQEEHARIAKPVLHGHTFGNVNVSAEILGDGKRSRLIARNLSFRCSEKHLSNIFSSIGDVVNVTIPHEGNKRSGFGFIQFTTQADAQKAIDKLNGSKIDGRVIAVDWALPKDKYLSHIIKRGQGSDDIMSTLGSETNYDSDESSAATKTKPDTKMKESKNDDASSSDEDDEKDKDDESDEDSDAEKEDEESSSLEEEDSDEEEDEEEEEEEEEEEIGSADVHKGETLFLRNVSFDSNQQVLQEYFTKYGEVEYVHVPRDFESNRPRGVAFVKFTNKSSADACLKEAYAKPSEAEEGKESKLEVDGRNLIITVAVDRKTAVTLQQTKKKKKEKKDKRNLYLAYEGVITEKDDAAIDMSKSDLQKRQRALLEKKTKLRNPNFFVSPTRLSVRNIPLELTDKQLRTLFQEHGKSSQIKQVKIIRDQTKTDQTTGEMRSRGFGFVEFREHDDALRALRALNNNPRIWSKTARPIVEFAVESAQALQKLDAIKKRGQVIPKRHLEEDFKQAGKKRGRNEKDNKQPPAKKSKTDVKDAGDNKKPKETKQNTKNNNDNKNFKKNNNNGGATKTDNTGKNNAKPQQKKPATAAPKAPAVRQRELYKKPTKKKEVTDSFDNIVQNYKRKFLKVAEDTTKGNKEWFE